MHAIALPLALALAAPAVADERTIMITSFDRVRIDGPYVVRVVTGASPRARIAGDRDSIEGISVRSDAGTLVVAPAVNSWGERPTRRGTAPVITVSTGNLRAAVVRGGGMLSVDRMAFQRVDLQVSGAGSIAVDAIAAERVDGAVYGTGTLKVAGRALDARFSGNGPATIDAAGLDATTLQVNAQGLSGGMFAARSTASVNASGSGPIRISGMPTCTVRGNAPVTCGGRR